MDLRSLHLPADILELIVSLFPLHPRLRVISLISKAWRFAALRSVKHWPPVKHRYPRSTLPAVLPLQARRIFPQLHSLEISSRDAACWVAPLTRLMLRHQPSIGASSGALCRCHDLSWLSSLQELEFSSEAQGVPCGLVIATRNASSLTSLRLTVPPGFLLPFQLKFPALHSLYLEAAPDECVSFLLSYASQLQSVSLAAVSQGPLLQTLIDYPFPYLSNLSIAMPRLPPYMWFSVQEDQMDATWQLAHVFAKYGSQLHRSELYEFTHSLPVSLVVLAHAAPSLRTLTLGYGGLAIAMQTEEFQRQFLQAIYVCSRITKLDIVADPTLAVPDVALLVNLTELQLSPHRAFSAVQLHWSLELLPIAHLSKAAPVKHLHATRTKLEAKSSTMEGLLQEIKWLQEVAPNLRQICVTGMRLRGLVCNERSVKLLDALAVSSCLEEIEFVSTDLAKKPNAPMLAKSVRWIRVTFLPNEPS